MGEDVRIEWGIYWGSLDEVETGTTGGGHIDGGEGYARRVVEQYRGQGARLARREVRRTLWTEAE